MTLFAPFNVPVRFAVSDEDESGHCFLGFGVDCGAGTEWTPRLHNIFILSRYNFLVGVAHTYLNVMVAKLACNYLTLMTVWRLFNG